MVGRRSIAKWLGLGSKRISRTGLYSFLDAEFARIPPRARVLSVGAGGDINERLCRIASERGFEVIQIDIDPKRGADVVGDIQTWQTDQPFDFVVISEVLEHLTDPNAAVTNIHELLRSRGRLIATLPFIFPIHGSSDYYRFTRLGIEHLFRKFHDVTIRSRASWPEAFGVLAVRLARERGRRGLELFVVPAALAAAPVLRLVGRLLPSEIITIGYTVVATR